MDIIVEFIKQVINEDRNLLKNWSSKTDDQFEKELIKLGMIPIPRGTSSGTLGDSFVGMGSYQVAYEVLWKNRRAIAKFSFSVQDDGSVGLDAIKTLKMANIRDELPGKYKKHVMKVYQYFDSSEHDINYDVIVVEPLVPLPQSMRRDIWGQYYEPATDPYANERSSAVTIEDAKDIVVTAFRKKAASYDIDQVLSSETHMDEISSVVLNGMKNYAIDSNTTKTRKFNSRKYEYELYKTLKRVFSQFDIDMGPRISDVIDAILIYAGNLLNRAVFPHDHTQPSWMINKTLKHPDKRIRSFMEFILYIDKELGISWADVHDDNVMMRPKTGDLVVADPGLFKFDS